MKKILLLSVSMFFVLPGYSQRPVIFNITNPTCNSSCNGIATASVDGTGPYTYIWNSGATDRTLSNLCTGTYAVTITDGNGESSSDSIHLQASDSLKSKATSTNATCYGLCNGSVFDSISGADFGPFTFQWSNTSAGQSQSGLCPGTYCDSVSDANGCWAKSCVVILQPDSLSPQLGSATNVSCYGQCDGGLSYLLNGGTKPYTYQWSGGSQGNGFSPDITSVFNLCAGYYCLTITDANGCAKTVCNNISTPDSLHADVQINNAGCGGNCNGSATLSVTGGTVPYSYSWVSGKVLTPTISNLCPNTYCYQVTDFNGCTKSGCITISEGSVLVQIANINTTCYGACNGTATAVTSGGTLPLTFQWNNGSTTESISNLCAGLYCVTVTDAGGCTTSMCQVVAQPDSLYIQVSSTSSTVCSGACSGTATTTVTGGTTPYSFLWSNNSTTQNISNLCGSQYCNTITDAQGCKDTRCVNVTVLAQISAGVRTLNPVCNGSCTGIIILSPSGGATPYTITWDNGSASTRRTSLCAGSYCYTITDAGGCSISNCVTITQPEAIIVKATIRQITCNGLCNGSITPGVGGGTAPYTFRWSTGSTKENIIGLCPGVYNLTVTDASGCTKLVSFILQNPVALNVSLAGTNTLCNGSCNGSITPTVTGGTVPYSYHWSNNSTSQIAKGLCAGVYCLTVTDANGCQKTTCALVTQPDILRATDSTTVINCNGNCNGRSIIEASGGTPPYSYNWSNGTTSVIATGLCGGSQCYTVTDSHGCTATGCANVRAPNPLQAGATVTNPSCNGGCNGFALLSVTGGTTPYRYKWSTGATTQGISGLCPGIYCFTVTDARGCTSTACVSVVSPPQLIVTLSPTPGSCNSQCSGKISTIVTGGIVPYKFVWSTGATTQNLINLCQGVYRITVTDAHGCSTTATATVSAPPPLVVATNSIVPASCYPKCNGSININVSGGTLPYTYVWSNGAATQNINAICGGTYQVTVVDAHGCSNLLTVVVPTSCPVPTHFRLIGRSPQGATLAWTGDCDGLSYTVQYRATNTLVWHTLTTADTTIVISGLTIGSTYQAEVRANCVNSATSAFSGPLTIPPLRVIGLREESAGQPQDNTMSQVQVYPNPTAGTLSIELSAQTNSVYSLAVFNILGMQVYTVPSLSGSNLFTVSLPDMLADGIYIIRLSDNKNTFTDRIILQRH